MASASFESPSLEALVFVAVLSDAPLLDPPPQAARNNEDRTNAVHVKDLEVVMLVHREVSKRGAMVLEPGPGS